jgi:ABC-2 type transport system permease protein
MRLGLAFLQILLLDLGFLALCVIAIAPLMTYKKAAFAVLKRNFVGYFSNPTGYVFLCLFVLLTSFAAFWPHDFFVANLANLDQLNSVLPLIMLVFIPAITMSIWAEERRQGTDELLLTLPADDFDIVIGKYLAAAAIFTASLMFSQFSNYMVLASLSMGNLDTGLFFTTYLGYWFVGLAMLAIGMVASFLTSNMTVGFILGAAFNAPLAFASSADVITSGSLWARRVSFWGLGANFDDLGRGVVSTSSVFYFSLLVALGSALGRAWRALAVHALCRARVGAGCGSGFRTLVLYRP